MRPISWRTQLAIRIYCQRETALDLTGVQYYHSVTIGKLGFSVGNTLCVVL